MSIWVHVIPWPLPSSAVVLVKPVMACFEMVYGKECGRGTCADSDPLLMILPEFSQNWKIHAYTSKN